MWKQGSCQKWSTSKQKLPLTFFLPPFNYWMTLYIFGHPFWSLRGLFPYTGYKTVQKSVFSNFWVLNCSYFKHFQLILKFLVLTVPYQNNVPWKCIEPAPIDCLCTKISFAADINKCKLLYLNNILLDSWWLAVLLRLNHKECAFLELFQMSQQ